MDKGGGVCGTKGVAAARCWSLFLFERFLEGEEVILPCLHGLVLWYFFVPFGAVLGERVRLEEQRGCDGGKNVV